MNRGITFSFVLMTMAISIFTIGNYQLIHASAINNNPKDSPSANDKGGSPSKGSATSTSTPTPNDKGGSPSKGSATSTSTPNDKGSSPSKGSTNANDKPKLVQQQPFLLPFDSTYANTIPFP